MNRRDFFKIPVVAAAIASIGAEPLETWWPKAVAKAAKEFPQWTIKALPVKMEPSRPERGGVTFQITGRGQVSNNSFSFLLLERWGRARTEQLLPREMKRSVQRLERFVANRRREMSGHIG